MFRALILIAAVSLAAGCVRSAPVAVASDPSTSSISKPVSGTSGFAQGKERLSGMFDLLVDRAAGHVYLELPNPGEDGRVAELLYLEGLANGIGSNPVGLDRGQIGAPRVVVFRRVGNRLLVEQPNLRYRALSEDPAEIRAVEESFASSVLWSGKVVAEDKGGPFIVDFTDFVVRDAHGVSRRLAELKEGTFKLDATRSVLDASAVLAFPDNLEFEAILTFAGSSPGAELRSVTPSAESLSIVQHHSLVRLPDDGYAPRVFDARAGSWAVDFLDYAVPLEGSMRTAWIGRHRLQKTHPGPEPSTVVEPIVYYVDRAAPERVRNALIEGAQWWADAFAKAGFLDAFRVEVMPEGAHPLDVRYNVIQWVHRSTRGWSYGNGIVDPRTGEILKGHVSLGSLRVRQDRRIFEGLLGAEKTGSGDPDDPVELALARIRQLAAHEVGHTLGLRHNFCASTYDNRASVMDYPAPLVHVTADGRLDASQAYGVGVGSWDNFAIAYAYTDFGDADEASALDRMASDAVDHGLIFGGDQDARPRGSAHPLAHLWDNGSDPVTALEEALEVRRVALENFGRHNLASGAPATELQETFAPVWFWHRYQAEAAAKLIGGVNYGFGPDAPDVQPVDAGTQRRALRVLLRAMDPAELDVPEAALAILSPATSPVPGRSRERFGSRTAPVFDPRSAAITAMDMVGSLLLEPERCARLNEQFRRDHNALSLAEMLHEWSRELFERRASTERLRSLQRGFQSDFVARIIERASDPLVSDDVRSVLETRLGSLQQRLVRRSTTRGPDAAHDSMLAREIDRFLNQQPWELQSQPARAIAPPPGSPIGLPAFGGCGG